MSIASLPNGGKSESSLQKSVNGFKDKLNLHMQSGGAVMTITKKRNIPLAYRSQK